MSLIFYHQKVGGDVKPRCRLSETRQKKIKMASYLEAATERLLDLASLRDHKNMLLSEFLNGKGVFCNRFWQIFVSLQVSSLILPKVLSAIITKVLL